MFDQPMHLNGLKVTIAPPVPHSYEVKRKWKERLFTLPWHPFKSKKVIHSIAETLLDDQIIKTDQGLFMNAKTWQRCQNEIKYN